MNKDLLNEEMSKKLESEYKNLVLDDVPDLWSRIEAGLEPKQNIQLNESVNHSNNTGKDSNKIVSFKKRYKAWGTVAAACACVAIALPVFVNSINNKSISEGITSEEISINNIASADKAMDKDNSDYLNSDLAAPKNPDIENFDFSENLFVEEILDNEFEESEMEYSKYVAEAEILDKNIIDEDIVYAVRIINADIESWFETDEEIEIYDYVSENNELELFEKYELVFKTEISDTGEEIYRLIDFE